MICKFCLKQKHVLSSNVLLLVIIVCLVINVHKIKSPIVFFFLQSSNKRRILLIGSGVYLREAFSSVKCSFN